MAGGDGSLINYLMNAKTFGVDLETLRVICLPYRTGNDTARTLGWGGTPSDSYYRTLKSLMREICLNSEIIYMNVWDISVDYKDEGGTFTVDKKRRYTGVDSKTFQRFMINYFGIGMDA